MSPTIELYPFEYFDARRRRWTRARYVATLDAIAERGEPFRILGAPEVRDVPDDLLSLAAGHLARRA